MISSEIILSANKKESTTAMRRSLSETIEEEESPAESKMQHLKRNTPILFSTNRGLHLRTTTTVNTAAAVTSDPTTSTTSSSRSSGSSTNSTYNMTFCDLERWSTNRANTISLEDTFTIPKPAVVPSSAARGSLASTSLRFLPHKPTSVRFNGYTRFDVE